MHDNSKNNLKPIGMGFQNEGLNFGHSLATSIKGFRILTESLLEDQKLVEEVVM